MSFAPETAALLVAIGLAVGALGTLIGAGGGSWALVSRSGCAGLPSNGYWQQRCLPSQHAS